MVGYTRGLCLLCFSMDGPERLSAVQRSGFPLRCVLREMQASQQRCVAVGEQFAVSKPSGHQPHSASDDATAAAREEEEWMEALCHVSTQQHEQVTIARSLTRVHRQPAALSEHTLHALSTGSTDRLPRHARPSVLQCRLSLQAAATAAVEVWRRLQLATTMGTSQPLDLACVVRQAGREMSTCRSACAH